MAYIFKNILLCYIHMGLKDSYSRGLRGRTKQHLFVVELLAQKLDQDKETR